MAVEGVSAIPAGVDENSNLRIMIQESQRKAQAHMNERKDIQDQFNVKSVRRQIETLNFYTDRGLANEMANRDMSSMFGSFTLINRIIQGMG